MVVSKRETGTKINSLDLNAEASTLKLETCTWVHMRKARDLALVDYMTPRETRSTKVNSKMTDDKAKALFTGGTAKC